MKQSLEQLLKNPVDLLESKYGYYIPETGKPIKHQAWERRLLTQMLSSNKKVRIIGSIKKDLKTTKAAEIAYITALMCPNSEIYIISNDFEQSKSRVFTYLLRSIERNPFVSARATTNQITFSNGTFIKALPSDYRGEAGSNPRLSVFDEPWGFVRESAVRMVEEFTPPPNLPDAFQLYVGYAGFESESKLWLDMYTKAIQGQPVEGLEDLPIYETDHSIMYWSHGPLKGHPGQPWHTAEYFEEQKATLRPFQFIRFFQNEWVTGSESFVGRAMWRACVDTSYTIMLPSKQQQLYVGVDAGIKSDNAAVMSVFVDQKLKKVLLGPYRIWHPTRSQPLDIEETIGAYLRFLCGSYRVKSIHVDPFQLHQLITNLKKERLPIQEFPQTTGNLTQATQNLYDLLTQRNIVLTNDPELEEHSQNAVAVESSRGLKLAKEKSGRKIDAIVALSFACLFAVENMKSVECYDIGVDPPRDEFYDGLLFDRRPKRPVFECNRQKLFH